MKFQVRSLANSRRGHSYGSLYGVPMEVLHAAACHVIFANSRSHRPEPLTLRAQADVSFHSESGAAAICPNGGLWAWATGSRGRLLHAAPAEVRILVDCHFACVASSDARDAAFFVAA